MTIGNGGLAHDYPTSLTAADVGKFVTFDDALNELVVATTPATIGAGVLLGVRSVNGNTLGRAAFDGPVSIKAAFAFVAGQFITNDAAGNGIKHLVTVPPQAALAIANGPTVNGFVPAFLLGNGATSGAGGPSITPYVVGPESDAPYHKIQPAIDAAFAAGGGAVYVRQQSFSYVEDLTLRGGVDVIGVNQAPGGAGARVTVEGHATFTPATGDIVHLSYLQLAPSTPGPAILFDGTKFGVLTALFCAVLGDADAALQLDNSGGGSAVACAFTNLETTGVLPVGVGVINRKAVSTVGVILVDVDLVKLNAMTDAGAILAGAGGVDIRRSQLAGQWQFPDALGARFIDCSFDTTNQAVFLAENQANVNLVRCTLNQAAPTEPCLKTTTLATFEVEGCTSLNGLTRSASVTIVPRLPDDEPEPSLLALSSGIDAATRFVVFDTTAGAVSATLPPLSSLPPGMAVEGIHGIQGGANAADFTPFAGDLINNAAAAYTLPLVTNAVRLRADPVRGTWWATAKA